MLRNFKDEYLTLELSEWDAPRDISYQKDYSRRDGIVKKVKIISVWIVPLHTPPVEKQSSRLFQKTNMLQTLTLSAMGVTHLSVPCVYLMITQKVHNILGRGLKNTKSQSA
jgi:hypothetical protein